MRRYHRSFITYFVYNKNGKQIDCGLVRGERGARGIAGAQGKPGLQGPQGEQGAQGLQGEPGKSAYQSYRDGGGKLTEKQWIASISRPEAPTFAQTVEDMIDTEKVYVMPDGHIWAYTYVDGPLFTNQIPLSRDANGAIYNGIGYKNNTRLGSALTESENAGVFVTGFIPVKQGDVIRFGGNIFSGTNGGFNSSAFNTNKQNIASMQMSPYTWSNNTTSVTNHYTPYDYDNETKTLHSITVNDQNAVYMRFTLSGNGEGAIITVNEEIAYGKTYKWADTGLTYTPSDYEDRIVILENNAAGYEKRIAVLEEGVDESGVVLPPSYWREAVDGITDTVKERQDTAGIGAFQFIWLSDIHGAAGYVNTNGAGTGKTAEIGKVAQYAAEKFNIPFVAISGDIMSQASHTDVSSVYGEYEAVRKILSPVAKEKLLTVKGNHDGAWGSAQSGVYYLKNIGTKKIFNEIFRRQAMDRQRVFGADGTYFYVDSPQRVRFIMLNSNTDGDGSTDAGGNAVYNSQKTSVYGTEQLNWLSEVALDMPKGWIAVVMAHQPFSSSEDGALVAGILSAYNARKSYSGTVNITANYWGSTGGKYNTSTAAADFKNAEGKVAAFFHGHIHKDTVDSTTYSFPCIAITTAGGDVRDDDPVKRVPDTATETAMDIVTVDREKNMIYMTRLGAGNDRSVKISV